MAFDGPPADWVRLKREASNASSADLNATSALLPTCPWRKHFSANMLGQNVVIYGGLPSESATTPSGEFLNMKMKAGVFLGFEKKTFAATNQNVPPPLAYHSAVEFGLRLYLFGGLTTGNKPVNDIYVYNQVSNSWSRPKSPAGPTEVPGPRWGHSATAINRSFLIFGGAGAEASLAKDTFYMFDTDSCAWTKLPSENGPSPRHNHSAVHFRDQVFIFGGLDAGGLKNDLYCWNNTARTWTLVSGKGLVPAPRAHHSAVMVGRMMYIFGGQTSQGATRDAFAFDVDSSTWHSLPRAVTSLPALAGHAALFHSGENLLFLVGGDGADLAAFSRRMGNHKEPDITGGASSASLLPPPTSTPPSAPLSNHGAHSPAPVRSPTLALPSSGGITASTSATLVSPKSRESSAGSTIQNHPKKSDARKSPRSSTVMGRDDDRRRSVASVDISPRTSLPGNPFGEAHASPNTVRQSELMRGSVGHSTGAAAAAMLKDSGGSLNSSGSGGKHTAGEVATIRGGPMQKEVQRQMALQPPAANVASRSVPTSARESRSGDSPLTGALGPSSSRFMDFMNEKIGSLHSKLRGGGSSSTSSVSAAAASSAPNKSMEEDDSSASESQNDTPSHGGSSISNHNNASPTPPPLTKAASEIANAAPDPSTLPAAAQAQLAALEPDVVVKALVVQAKDYFHHWKLRTYPRCLSGADISAWLEKYHQLGKPAALVYGQMLRDAGYFHHVPDSDKPYTDSSSHFFTFTDKSLALVPALLAEKEAKDRERREKRKEKRERTKSSNPNGTSAEATPEASTEQLNIEISGPKALVYSTKPTDSPKEEPIPSPTTTAAASAAAAAAAAEKEKEKEETPEQRAKRESHRQEVLRELIATERDYIRDLQIITKLYIEPLQNEKKDIIPRAQLDTIFLNINQLVPVNEMLLGDLEGVLAQSPDKQTLGVVFSKLANCFKMYSHYCTYHAASLNTLKQLKKNVEFSTFCEEVRQKPECRKLDLEAYLIKPLQRICRYPLLLKEVVKAMDKQHMDYESMQQAIEKTEAVVRDVNEAKRLAEHLNQVIEIQNSFVWETPEPELVTPTRRFLREGPVKKLTKSLTSNTSDRHFFLFNDLLLIGAANLGKNLMMGKKYTFKGMHPIENIIVWDVKDGDGGKHVKNAFTVVRTDKKDKTTFVAPSKEDKDAWVNTVNDCIINIPNLSKDRRDTKAIREAAFLAFKKTLVAQ